MEFWDENGGNGGEDGEGKLWQERAGFGAGLGGQMDGGSFLLHLAAALHSYCSSSFLNF